MKSDQEDMLWANRVIQGDTEAFALLVNKYKDMVFTLALKMIHHREEAEEVAQDVFLKIFKALPKFKQKAKFSTWMYRIAYNECISRLRKKKNAVISIENIPGSAVHSMEVEMEDWQNEEIRSEMLNSALNAAHSISARSSIAASVSGCSGPRLSRNAATRSGAARVLSRLMASLPGARTWRP